MQETSLAILTNNLLGAHVFYCWNSPA